MEELFYRKSGCRQGTETLVLLVDILSIYWISPGTNTILHTESRLGKRSRKYKKKNRQYFSIPKVD